MTWKYVVYRAAPLFFIIMLVSYFAGDGWRAIPSALVAWGTILLAFATFTLIRHSRDQEEQRRKDDQAKERRDRDIALLNEIAEWAVSIVKIGIPAQSVILVSSLDDESERRLIQNTLLALNNDFRASVAVSLYVCSIALAFGEKLKSNINTLDIDIRKQGDLIEECIKIVNRRAASEFDKTWTVLIANWEKLGESAANVIDEAVIEKLTILNI